MVDVHCHLDNPRLRKYIPEAGLIMITNGTGWKSSIKAVELANKYPNVWACVGLAYEKGFKLSDAEARLESLAMNTKVVGIGECGLNYQLDTDEETKTYQRQLFRCHLRVAEKLKLPVEVHNRNADDDILHILSDYPGLNVLMHCFTRNREFMKKCAERDWYMSFGGLVTYDNNSRMKAVATEMPEKLLLLETDAPYSTPIGTPGNSNTPSNVKIVAGAVACLKGTTQADIDRITTKNARSLFTRMV